MGSKDESFTFPVDGDKMQVLHNPAQFYNSLVESLQKATTRVTLSSLYLGSGTHERKILEAISSKQKALAAQGHNLIVNILFDYNRTLRSPGTIRLISDILDLASINCHLYHSSLLHGTRKRLAPKRWDEIFGVFHMKCYVIDDVCFLSGANLSEDYFTNRQDRYIKVKCESLCDYITDVSQLVSKMSYRLVSDGTVEWNPVISEPWKNPQLFRMQTSQMVQQFMREQSSKLNRGNISDTRPSESSKENALTTIEVMMQAPEQCIEQYSTASEKIINSLTREHKLYLASGYFNLSDNLRQALVNCRASKIDILACSRYCNGFKTAKGAAKYVCDMYEYLLEQFIIYVEQTGKKDKFSIFEYYRDNWTYHAKGIWIYSLPPIQGQAGSKVLKADSKNMETTDFICTATLIGSSNFGMRSQYRDMELQFYLKTRDKNVQQKLHLERKHLFRYKQFFDRNQVKYKFFIPTLSKMVRTFF